MVPDNTPYSCEHCYKKSLCGDNYVQITITTHRKFTVAAARKLSV